MSGDLVRLCASHGIESSYVAWNGEQREVPAATLQKLASTFGLRDLGTPPPTIAEVLADPRPARCYLPAALRQARCWGVTCQVPSLASDRNLGIGDFADLAVLAETAGAAGADFLGTNPLHALLRSDPGRVSPFSPSNRRFLNPLYIAPDWIAGFAGPTAEEAAAAGELRAAPLLDVPGAARLKQSVLQRCFERFPWDDARRAAFARFRQVGGEALEAHALFEALSAAMVAEGASAGWLGWPEAYRDRHGPKVAAFAERERPRVDYELWLQWQADAQLAMVQDRATAAGMRIGLCLDLAVGAVADGSAAWTAPSLTVPQLSIGAPPDEFSPEGQDWGLAPLSPIKLGDDEAKPFAAMLAAVLRHAGAARIDHAMNLARLWLIPQGEPARNGAYVRFPLRLLMARLAEESQSARAIILGEDLGTVPEGFRPLLTASRLHGYTVYYFERTRRGFRSPKRWPTGSIACVGTHDMPTFAGWWRGLDLDLRRNLGLLTEAEWQQANSERNKDRAFLRLLLGDSDDPAELSPRLHAHIATSRCRLVALQIEDALGLAEQINVPGTTDAYPNWRHRLPVPVAAIAAHPGFQAHASALRAVRPR